TSASAPCRRAGPSGFPSTAVLQQNSLFAWCFFQPTLLEQRFDARVASSKRTIQRPEILGAAARENHVSISLAILPGQSTVLDEPGIGIVIQDLAPQIRIVC